MPTPDNGISITHELGTDGWSNEETAAYEAVNGLVGTYTAVIVAEEAKAQPNREAIDAARAAQQRLAREREALRSTDHQQIAEARARYATLAREVRAALMRRAPHKAATAQRPSKTCRPQRCTTSSRKQPPGSSACSWPVRRPHQRESSHSSGAARLLRCARPPGGSRRTTAASC